METKKLSVGDILSNGVSLGIKNLLPLIVNYILFLLTFWIPYLNVGTFIGITSGLPLKMSKGETISYTEIFNPTYRKYFGEYFLMLGMKMIGTYVAIIFMVIPAIVLSLSWYIADLIFLDGKAGIIDSLKKSNELIYGNKLSIFLASIVFVLGFLAVLGLLMLLNIEILIAIGYFVMLVVLVPIIFGIKAYVYQELSGNHSSGDSSAE